MAAKHVQFSSDFLSSMTLDGAYTDAAAVADVADSRGSGCHLGQMIKTTNYHQHAESDMSHFSGCWKFQWDLACTSRIWSRR